MKRIFIPGVFDLMHKGHHFLISEASKIEDSQIVLGVITEEGCKLKGKDPIWTEKERIAYLKKQYPNMEVITTDGTAEDYIRIYKDKNIDIHFAGMDHNGDPKYKELENHIEVIYVDRLGNYSSTSQREKILSEEVKTVQKEVLKIFKDVNRIFEENNITWYAHAGTLLGAVKYGSLVKWDDDIDMLMTSNEIHDKYDLIVKVLDDNGYVFQNQLDEKDLKVKTPYFKIYKKEKYEYINGKQYLPFIDVMVATPVDKEHRIKSRLIKISLGLTGFVDHHFWLGKRGTWWGYLVGILVGTITFSKLWRVGRRKRMFSTKKSNKYQRLDWQAHKNIIMTFDKNNTVVFEGIELKTLDDIDKYFSQFYHTKDITAPPDPDKIIKNQHTDVNVK